MSLARIQNLYGIPARYGDRVSINGKKGKVIGAVGDLVCVRWSGDLRGELFEPWEVYCTNENGLIGPRVDPDVSS